MKVPARNASTAAFTAALDGLVPQLRGDRSILAVILGGTLALALLASGKRGRKDPIPFGPFLAAGGAAGLFYGERVVRWYLGGFSGF